MADPTFAEIITAYGEGLWAHLPAASWLELPIVLSFVPSRVEKLRDQIRRRLPDALLPLLRKVRNYSAVLIAIGSILWASFATFRETFVREKQAENKVHLEEDYRPEVGALNAKISSLSNLLADATRVRIKTKLSDLQKHKLRESIAHYVKQGRGWQDVYMAENNDESSVDFGNALLDIFAESHLNLIQDGYSFTGTGEKGIVLYLVDPKHPTAQAVAFMGMLRDAGIPYMIGLPWVPRGGWIPLSTVGFQIFICPDS